jgi:membrane-bound lytic murein transglycosylase A
MMRPQRFTTLIAALLLLCSCAPREKPPERLTVSETGFDRLPGWEADHLSEAFPAFLASCSLLLEHPEKALPEEEGVSGRQSDWRQVCSAARTLGRPDDSEARRFFETNFVPFQLGNHGETEGLFTGYFEIELKGSRRRGGSYLTPIYRRPPDLVMVDLGLFRTALQGQRIAGRVVEGTLHPYDSRADIAKGVLDRRGLELFWLDDPIGAFFLEIQGSGRILLPDGSVMRVGYDGQNGHPYVPLGRILAERGALSAERISMQAIRAWLEAHPDEAQTVMNENPSYVFFREIQGDRALGAAGIPLTPGRSLAVDRNFLPLGVPLWLDADDPLEETGHLRRLMIAQDTGGAIRGPVRGDVFWGHGAQAAERAGTMKDKGSYYLLVPRGATERRFPAG